MEPHKGFYSLVQFCPDRGRAEAVNIGLVLFVPALKHLEVRTVKTSKRIAQVFGKGAVDAWWLKTSRESFERGVVAEHQAGRFNTPEDLDRYLASLGNDVVPTPSRPTRVESPSADMERLFARLVEPSTASILDAFPPIVKPLDDAFQHLRVHLASIQFGRKFRVEGYHHEVQTDYMFMNECANLVRLLRIGDSAARTFDQAVKLGGESVFVKKHVRVEDEGAKLIIVAAPLLTGVKAADTEEKLGRLYLDFPDATWIPSDGIVEFAQHVQEVAR